MTEAPYDHSQPIGVVPSTASTWRGANGEHSGSGVIQARPVSFCRCHQLNQLASAQATLAVCEVQWPAGFNQPLRSEGERRTTETHQCPPPNDPVPPYHWKSSASTLLCWRVGLRHHQEPVGIWWQLTAVALQS